jgi:hypothetical protein
MTTPTLSLSPRPTGWRLALLGLGALLAGAAAPGVAQVEPLTLRVADAEAAPGGTVAVVLRTYASRPVSQGRVCGGPRPPTAVAAPLDALFSPARAPEIGPGSPFAAFLEPASRVFAAGGAPTALWTWTDAVQTLDVDFSSLDGSINADDGVLAVLSFTLDPALAPGTTYDFQVDPAESFLRDPDGVPIPIEIRPGRVRVRSAATNPSLSIGAPKVHPGSGAELELETAEPFAIASGHLELFYDPAIADGTPTVRTDPRHGPVTPTVSFPAAGQVVIDFTSASPARPRARERARAGRPAGPAERPVCAGRRRRVPG